MTYCISDIHGEYELFMRLLDKIGYSDSDRLIVCGDFIDKGTASIRLAKSLFAMPNAYCIKGNHEYAFFKFYRSRMHAAIMDFDAILWQLQQYFPEDGHLLDWDTVDMLADLPYYIEDDDFICVHAGVPLDDTGMLIPLEYAIPEELVEDRRFKDPQLLPKDGKCVLFGHTPTTYLGAKPEILTYARNGRDPASREIADYCKIHLDTGTPISGVLGCFCIEDCRAHYVNK